ncbi:MAG: hypothetical protein RLZZ566_1818 [Pseudomonadota bacterium]
MKLALSTKLCMAVCLWLGLSISAYAAKEVSLVFAGDTVLDDTAGKIIEQGGDPFSDFADYFAGADIRITNMECVVSTRGQANDKMYTFQAHPRVIPVLQKHFDAVTLANNHSGDFGPDAFAQMLSLLKEAGLAQIGGGMNLKQAHTPLVFTRNGWRIAVLSYNEFHPRSFEAGFDIPGVAWSEDQQVMEDIQTARRIHRADLVIPIMHWGWENERTANPRQRQLAKLMIDAGADAVIGGHPHVTQDVSVYKGKPIVYSVGNFVMKETDNAFQRKGWVLKMYFDKRGVTRFETLPVKIDMEGIPSIDRAASSPCWQRGDNIAGECQTAPAE